MTETWESHLAWILERIGRTTVEARSVRSAHRHVLAEDLLARHDLPLWDASAMDGYAVRSADTAGATERHAVELKVIGEVAAGSDDDPEMPAGSAVRIMTGAPIPTDADAVVPVEATGSDRVDDPWAERMVAVRRPAEPGANVRSRGEDVRLGATIARAGEELGAARLSALAAAGVSSVRVFRRPRIAVVTTGSELQPTGAELRRGQIHESNSLLIVGLLEEAGFEVATVEHRHDEPDGLAGRLAELAASHDAIVTTGVVGPGRHDVVRIALEGEPGVRAVRVAVRPGQPQCAGRHRGGAFLFGLPGNPVSAATSIELFVRPALRSLAGHTGIHRLRLPATAAKPWIGKVGRLQVLPVRIAETAAGLVCTPTVAPSRVSHSVGGHGQRDGYALVEPERGDVAAGEPVVVIETGP